MFQLFVCERIRALGHAPKYRLAQRHAFLRCFSRCVHIGIMFNISLARFIQVTQGFKSHIRVHHRLRARVDYGRVQSRLKRHRIKRSVELFPKGQAERYV
ncbi:hypothetical protein SDC9_143004 [bioreactor metagenome]|uniref:Uncharacterized protein n=1 Tax=bioreactor metagenome TaxID=1076179 RepID=A0A645E2T7_9ZZZZ